MGERGKLEYTKALRRCYFSLLLKPETVPNPEDAQHKELVEMLKKTNMNVLTFGIVGVPLFYFLYTKVLKPQFPVQPGKRVLSLFGAITVYVVGLRLMSETKDMKRVLASLTQKYEKELTLQCPELKSFSKASEPTADKPSS